MHSGLDKVCVPIETLADSDWRLSAETKRNYRSSVVNKAELTRGPSKAFHSRHYVDLGARTYKSSIGSWFRKSYPDAATFKVHAFEVSNAVNSWNSKTK